MVQPTNSKNDLQASTVVLRIPELVSLIFDFFPQHPFFLTLCRSVNWTWRNISDSHSQWTRWCLEQNPNYLSLGWISNPRLEIINFWTSGYLCHQCIHSLPSLLDTDFHVLPTKEKCKATNMYFEVLCKTCYGRHQNNQMQQLCDKLRKVGCPERIIVTSMYQENRHQNFADRYQLAMIRMSRWRQLQIHLIKNGSLLPANSETGWRCVLYNTPSVQVVSSRLRCT